MHNPFTFFNFTTDSSAFPPFCPPPPPLLLHIHTPASLSTTDSSSTPSITDATKNNDSTVYSTPRAYAVPQHIGGIWPSTSTTSTTTTSASPLPPSLPQHSSPALKPTPNVLPNPLLLPHHQNPYGTWYDYIPNQDVTKPYSSSGFNQFNIVPPHFYNDFVAVVSDFNNNNINDINNSHSTANHTTTTFRDNSNNNDIIQTATNDTPILQQTQDQQQSMMEPLPLFSHILPYVQEFVSEVDIGPPAASTSHPHHHHPPSSHQHVQHHHHSQQHAQHHHHHHSQVRQHHRVINNNLIHLTDTCGVVDYMFKSCSGKPYGGEKLSTATTKFKNRTPIFQGNSILEKTLPRTLYDIMDDEVASTPQTHNAASTVVNSLFDQQEEVDKLASSDSSFSLQSLETIDDSSLENGSLDSVDAVDDGYIKIPPQELLSSNCTTIRGTNRVKSKLCRSFIYDKCYKRDCNFLHAKPLTVHRDQIIFLGGIPSHVGRKQLYHELKRAGVPVINLPMVIDRFTPRVALSSKESAQHYINLKHITLFDQKVDVRPYKQSHEVYQIFLGGLLPETTADDIRYSLKSYNCDLINIPTINKGYSINVEVKSKEQQKKLLSQKHIYVLGKLVEVKKITKRTKFKKRYYNQGY